MQATEHRFRNPVTQRRVLLFVVGLVLADAAIVMLALPAIYREFSAEVADVAWVITSFNLALALAAIPISHVVSRLGAARICGAGCIGFAVASLVCAAAPSLGVLIGARALQGVAGAAAVCAALELLPAHSGGEESVVRAWAAAGVAGAAIGPVVGGVLTQLISWQAIFVVQVPLALLPLVVLRRAGRARVAEAAGRPHVGANVALALLSAGLTAALFLIVLLLIEGWRMSPIAAAIVVTALPLASIASHPLEERFGTARVRAAAGALIGAGGLAALGLLPDPGWWWTIPPQVLVGAGLTLSLGGLTQIALSGRARHALHGGVTIASRHAGIVVGLVILTPVFVADLDRYRDRVELAGTATVLDAQVDPSTKLQLATTIAGDIARDPGRLPDVRASFGRVPAAADDRPAVDALAGRLDEQIDRAASGAFSRSFLGAALLAALGLLPIAFARGRVR